MDRSLDTWSEWTPTCHIRWRDIEHPHGGYDRFLEQKWERTKTLEDGDIFGEEIWRKVEICSGT